MVAGILRRLVVMLKKPSCILCNCGDEYVFTTANGEWKCFACGAVVGHVNLNYIIGVSGLIGAGKDTVANFVRAADPSFKMMRLATPLKWFVCSLYQVDMSALEDRNLKEAFRDPMVAVGETIRTTPCLGKSPWSECLVRRIKSGDATHVVVPDVRHPDEVEAWREELETDGWTVCLFGVIRPGVEEQPYSSEKFAARWTQEVLDTGSTDLVDFVFMNDGAELNLLNKVESVMAGIMSGKEIGGVW